MSNPPSHRDGQSPDHDVGDGDRESIPEPVWRQTREDPPYSPAEIRENVAALAYPLSLEDVSGVGETYAEELRSVGICDMVDLAIVCYRHPSIDVKQALREFPDDVEQRLRELAHTIHEDAILAADSDGDIGRVSESPPGDFWVPVPSNHSRPKSVAVARMQRKGVERCRAIDVVTAGGERRAVIRNPVLETKY
jgi:nucleotidyltransferase/DNA polymerase involved in DNA repair